MAHPWCTGPSHVYVGVGANGAPLYFGTTESTPMIEERPEYEPLMNDLGGSRKPFDFSFQGVDCIIGGTFTRYEWSVFRTMRAIPTGSTAAGTGNLGVSRFGDLGTFMIYEAKAYPVWLTFPYSAKAAMSGLTPGLRFVRCFLEAPIGFNGGTRPQRVHLTWYAARSFSIIAGGTMTCYDENVSGLPAVA